MKKSILVLGLAVAAMTSCTNDEVLDVHQPVQKAIGFEAFTNKVTRNATETTDAHLSKFHVYGYYGNDEVNVFSDVVVTKSGGGKASESTWGYAEEFKQYWTKNQYQFAAYADGNSGDALSPTFTTAKLTIDNYVVSDAKDLVADVVGIDNSGMDHSKVSFTFKHLLSKIQFVVRNTSAEYRMRIVSATVASTEAEEDNIAGLVISGVNTKGKCVVEQNETPEWTPYTPAVERADFVPFSATDDASFTSSSSDPGIFEKVVAQSQANAKTSATYFVMPQEVENITFKIRVEFLDDNGQVVKDKEVTGSLAGDNIIDAWIPGYFYTYQISLPTSAIPISFGVTNVDGFEPFEEAIELNYNDQNNIDDEE